MRRIKLVLADDHALMVEAVRLALKDEPDFEIAATADSGNQVLPLVARTGADMVVLDLRMPGMDGLTCIKLLKARFPEVRIAVLSGVDSDETVNVAMELGASVFVSKSVEAAELVRAFRRAVEGVVAEPVGRGERRMSPAAGSTGLTGRELCVLRSLGKGLSNKEIARSLWLAEQTVKFHLTNIYRKLGVTSRTDAVHWAYGHGLLEAPVGSSSLS
jgi:DNA-binding NarL/FixJ family response regulator